MGGAHPGSLVYWQPPQPRSVLRGWGGGQGLVPETHRWEEVLGILVFK